MHDPINIKSRFKFIVAVSIFLSLALLPLACQKESSGQAPQGTPAKPAGASRAPTPQSTSSPVSQSRDFILSSSYTGEVKAISKVDLTAKVSGRIKEFKVDVGDKVKAGDLLVMLEHDIPDIQVRQAETSLALARVNLAKLEEGSRKEQIGKDQAALMGVQAQLDLLKAGSKKEDIAAAKAKLDGAQADLDTLMSGATTQQIAIYTAQVAAAQAKYDSDDVETARTLATSKGGDRDTLNYILGTRSAKLDIDQAAIQVAQYQLDSLKAPPTPSAVAKYKAAVDAAKAALDSLLAPPRPEEVAQKQSAVDSAIQQVELTKNPSRENDFEISRIGVQQAQAALDLAKANRDEAYLNSPFDGIILARLANEGTLASPSLPLLTVISQNVQISIAIEEAAVGKVKPDQIWDMKVLAYPDRIFKGKVKAISPALNPATRTFDVILTPLDTDGSLLPGMFVTAFLPQ